ncbi:hypothetical protein UPYG_G00158360 [Umbra pygmaea]|uniref:Ig-like domain-containing protein n=1 Tax=Umbra pygmaea TaxID=75934 RepID=A0ABD0X2U0_UMBPY
MNFKMNVGIVFLLVLPGVTSEDIIGIMGKPLLLPCYRKLATPINPAAMSVYWQDEKNKVLHVIKNGKEDYSHQDPSYKNRTAFDTDGLASGNLSLLLNPVNVSDDHMTCRVILMSDTSNPEIVCPVTVNVASKYQTPRLTVNQTNMTVVCRTEGGYPLASLTFMIGNQIIDPGKENTMISQDPGTGTYNIRSQVTWTRSENITCSVHNPTLNETLSATAIPESKDDKHPTGSRNHTTAIVSIVLGLVLLAVIAGIFIKPEEEEQNDVVQMSGQAEEEESVPETADGVAEEADEKLLAASPPEELQAASPPEELRAASPPEELRAASPPEELRAASPSEELRAASPLEPAGALPPQERRGSAAEHWGPSAAKSGGS